jgi:hypothetical protein
MVMARVLLVDSQPLFDEALEALFSRDDAHQVVDRCSSAEDAPDGDVQAGGGTFAMRRSMELELTPGGVGPDH